VKLIRLTLALDLTAKQINGRKGPKIFLKIFDIFF
jgi:hypothetical protein